MSYIKSSRLILIFFSLSLLLTGCSERFVPMDVSVLLNGSQEVSANTTFLLEIQLSSDREGTISFYEDQRLTISLIGVNRDESLSLLDRNGTIVRKKVSPDNPIIFNIEGRVEAKKDGKFWVDFGELGVLLLNPGSDAMIKADIYPADIPLHLSEAPYQSEYIKLMNIEGEFMLISSSLISNGAE